MLTTLVSVYDTKMTRKELCVLLLTATLGFLPFGKAGTHGFGMHDLPDTCNETVLRSCLPPFMESGVLAPFSSSNNTKVDMAKTAEKANPDVCNTFEEAVSCLQDVESPCYNGSQTVTFTDLLELDYYVPRVSNLKDIWQQVCTSGAQSLASVSMLTMLLLTCWSVL